MRIVTPAVVALVGPSGAGKTTWALQQFDADEVVSSDRLRAVVGLGEHDQKASKAAFEVLDLIIRRRVERGLTAVVDTLGLDADLRADLIRLAHDHDLAVYAVGFDTPPRLCRARNKERAHPVPGRVISGQIESYQRVRPLLSTEGFDGVLFVADSEAPAPLSRVPAQMNDATEAAAAQEFRGVALEFGLLIDSFQFEDRSNAGERIAGIARSAEEAGFHSIWVMDHLFQIPQVGRVWDDMYESQTTISYLAASTVTARVGTLVTAAGYRNPALLGKMVATLDVLSGGRAICGLGAGWFEREMRAYGYGYPSRRERLDRLEDVLRLLPLLWGPGSPPFEGKTITVPEAMCYPRPLQERIPILVGGQGEQRTLRLVARHADMCNLFGEPEKVRHKLSVLHRHCETEGRDASELVVTHLGSALIGADPAAARALAQRLAPTGLSVDQYAQRKNAGGVDDHIGRFRRLADAGVQHAIVTLPDIDRGIGYFEKVIAAFA